MCDKEEEQQFSRGQKWQLSFNVGCLVHLITQIILSLLIIDAIVVGHTQNVATINQVERKIEQTNP